VRSQYQARRPSTRMPELVSRLVGRPVIDKTELKGEYMLSIQPILDEEFEADSWRRRAGLRPRRLAAARRRTRRRTPRALARSPSSRVLGLKLDPRKLSLPLLVIDTREDAHRELNGLGEWGQ